MLTLHPSVHAQTIWECRGHLPVCGFCHGVQENLIFPTLLSPSEADKAMRKEALPPIALKLGADSQSIKKSNPIKVVLILCSQIVPSTLQKKVLVQKNRIFRIGFLPLVILI